MIGTEVSNYRIESKLGAGGMGTVYRATDLTLDRPVAIKVLNPEFSRDPATLERFRAEAKAQANLHHTNIATLYAFVIQDGNAMMVMEFVDGENFQQMVHRRGHIPAGEAIPLFQQALSGIGAAHAVGIVHRDIKPANIMLNKQGVVKVMDFGIAKLMGERGLTRTGSQIGTVFYMSPEQVRGHVADQRSDIYALGVTLYEILTGRVPFMAESEFDVLTHHINSQPPPLSTMANLIPRPIENAVFKALAKRPEDRFQTVEEFSAALNRTVANDLDLTRPPPPRPPKKSSRAWLIVLLALLLSAAGLVLLRKAGAPAPRPVRPQRTFSPPPAPADVRIPAGTDIVVRLNSAVDSSLADVGEVFPVTVESPVVGEGRTLVEAGDLAQIRVVQFYKGKRFKSVAKLEFELNTLISGGKNYRVHTSRFSVDGERSKFLGFGGGTVKIPPGTPMSFRLLKAVIVTAR